MADRVPRLAACAVAVALVLGLVASQVVDSGHAPEARVGTEGPAGETDVEGRHQLFPESGGPDTATPTADEGAVAAGSPPRAAQGSVPTGPGASSTTTTAPAAADPAPTFSGPPHLRGRIVFVHDEPAPNTLWSAALDGSDRRREVPCPRPQDNTFPAAVSPDGRWVARLCVTTPMFQDLPGAPFGRTELVVQLVDGTETRRLAAYDGTGHLDSLAWSPDGTRLALVRALRLWVVDVSDAAAQELVPHTVDGPMTSVSGPVHWSPDGSALLLDGPMIVDVATGAARQPLPTLLWGTQEWGGSDLTVWAPDGWLYYRRRPEQLGPNPSTTQPVQRAHPDDEHAELVLPDLTPHGYHSGLIEPPVFVDHDTALVRRDGQLWRLEIGPVDEAWRFVEPSGTMTLLEGEFAGWWLSVATGTAGLAATG